MANFFGGLAHRAFRKFDTDKDGYTQSDHGVKIDTNHQVTKKEFMGKLSSILDHPAEMYGLFEDDSLFSKLSKSPETKELASQAKQILNRLEIPNNIKKDVKEMAAEGYDQTLNFINTAKPKIIPKFEGIPEIAIDIAKKEGVKFLEQKFDQLDTNHNDKLDKAEFEALKKMFSSNDSPTPQKPTIKSHPSQPNEPEVTEQPKPDKPTVTTPQNPATMKPIIVNFGPEIIP
jgi:hypothetical protein